MIAVVLQKQVLVIHVMIAKYLFARVMRLIRVVGKAIVLLIVVVNLALEVQRLVVPVSAMVVMKAGLNVCRVVQH